MTETQIKILKKGQIRIVLLLHQDRSVQNLLKIMFRLQKLI